VHNFTRKFQTFCKVIHESPADTGVSIEALCIPLYPNLLRRLLLPEDAKAPVLLTSFQQRTRQNYIKKDGYRQLNVRQLGGLRPWDHRGKCYMDRKRIQCLSNASQHVHIYLQPFTSYSEILVGNCNFFLPTLHLTPPYGVSPGTIAVNATWIEREFNAC